MRIERFADGWRVYADPGELDNAQARHLGFISERGGLTLSKRWGAIGRRNRAAFMLNDARVDLIRRGELVDRDLERRKREEARTGDFIVELDDGRERRFHTLRSQNTHERGTALYLPGAIEWAEDELTAGRASHADFFRGRIGGDSPRRMRIYEPTIIPARGEFGPAVVSLEQHLPIYSLTQRGGRLRIDRPGDVGVAYDLKAQAISLVDARMFRGEPLERRSGREPPNPAEISGAWDVALDAFLVAELPLQAELARENAEYWRKRATVSSRRGAARKRC